MNMSSLSDIGNIGMAGQLCEKKMRQVLTMEEKGDASMNFLCGMR